MGSSATVYLEFLLTEGDLQNETVVDFYDWFRMHALISLWTCQLDFEFFSFNKLIATSATNDDQFWLMPMVSTNKLRRR